MMTTQALPVVVNSMAGRVWIFGPLICRIYACLGAVLGKNILTFFIPKSTNELLLGTSSALSLVMIGYDRYNIICKGLDAKHMTWGGAFLCILGIWIYCIVVSVPPFFGWGGYALGMSNTNQKMYLGNF